MNILSKIKTNSSIIRNLSASVVIHFLVFLLVSAAMYFSVDDEIQRSQFVEIYTTTGESAQVEETVKEEEPEENKTEEITEKNKPVEEKPEEVSTGYMTLNSNNADTTGLQNIYKESTLNVRIKYPSGWTFIDQNVKNKLDGVTFWGTKGNYDPPPYIHLEVKEKYLFNRARYKYEEEMGDYTAYFNDPKEMAGQVSQEIYMVTDTEEDFSIKLIMEGEEDFKSFQPVFFGMLKTFKFGKSLF